MYIRMFAVALLSVFLAGCATTRTAQVTGEPASGKIAYLENEVEQQKQKISRLEEELRAAREEKVPPSRNPIEKLSTKEIQTILKNSGMYKGPVDGKRGSMTRKAIKDFQKANGLKADGIVGSRTLEALNRYR